MDLIHLISEDLKPFLLVKYESCNVTGSKVTSSKKKLQKARRKRLQRSSLRSNFIEKNYLYNHISSRRRKRSNKKADACKMEALKVNTSQLGHALSKRILLPSRITLNKCSGSCNFADSIDGDLEMTNHARFLYSYGCGELANFHLMAQFPSMYFFHSKAIQLEILLRTYFIRVQVDAFSHQIWRSCYCYCQ